MDAPSNNIRSSWRLNPHERLARVTLGPSTHDRDVDGMHDQLILAPSSPKAPNGEPEPRGYHGSGRMRSAGLRSQSGSNMSRIVVVVSGVLAVVVAEALLFASGRGMFHGRLPPDTLATNEAQAEDVAFSVASNAGCGDFDTEQTYAFDGAWQFGCTIGDSWYRIYVYGGDPTRSQGLAQLKADGRPYVAKAYYAVATVPYGATKIEVLEATPPPASIMDPFR